MLLIATSYSVTEKQGKYIKGGDYMIGIFVVITFPIWVIPVILILKPSVERDFNEWYNSKTRH